MSLCSNCAHTITIAFQSDSLLTAIVAYIHLHISLSIYSCALLHVIIIIILVTVWLLAPNVHVGTTSTNACEKWFSNDYFFYSFEWFLLFYSALSKAVSQPHFNSRMYYLLFLLVAAAATVATNATAILWALYRVVFYVTITFSIFLFLRLGIV